MGFCPDWCVLVGRQSYHEFLCQVMERGGIWVERAEGSFSLQMSWGMGL